MKTFDHLPYALNSFDEAQQWATGYEGSTYPAERLAQLERQTLFCLVAQALLGKHEIEVVSIRLEIEDERNPDELMIEKEIIDPQAGEGKSFSPGHGRWRDADPIDRSILRFLDKAVVLGTEHAGVDHEAAQRFNGAFIGRDIMRENLWEVAQEALGEEFAAKLQASLLDANVPVSPASPRPRM